MRKKYTPDIKAQLTTLDKLIDEFRDNGKLVLGGGTELDMPVNFSDNDRSERTRYGIRKVCEIKSHDMYDMSTRGIPWQDTHIVFIGIAPKCGTGDKPINYDGQHKGPWHLYPRLHDVEKEAFEAALHIGQIDENGTFHGVGPADLIKVTPEESFAIRETVSMNCCTLYENRDYLVENPKFNSESMIPLDYRHTIYNTGQILGNMQVLACLPAKRGFALGNIPKQIIGNLNGADTFVFSPDKNGEISSPYLNHRKAEIIVNKELGLVRGKHKK